MNSDYESLIDKYLSSIINDLLKNRDDDSLFIKNDSPDNCMPYEIIEGERDNATE